MLPLAEVERRHILRVMEFTKGDVTTAAQVLGVGRTTLYRRMKEYRALEDFDPPEWSRGRERSEKLSTAGRLALTAPSCPDGVGKRILRAPGRPATD
jgi:hypothetical protein